MTRDEEVRAAIDKAFPCTDEGRCYEQSIGASGFELGVKWADEHPVNVWHDASEIPNNHSYIMLMIDRYTIKTDYIPACLKHCQLNGSNWNEFVKATNMKRWAYVSDLLPKGGEL